MRKRFFGLCILFLDIFLFACTIASATSFNSRAIQVHSENLPVTFEDIVRNNYININRVNSHIRYLTLNCTPRVTGYSGFYKAQEYIYKKFGEYGLEDVQYQWYNITIPVDLGGELEVYSPNESSLRTYQVSHLWPNSVQISSTPPGGISGNLFYAGQGDYADYNGRVVNGSIVILDFNSMENWLKAMELGAKAIIFIEPETTNEKECETKYLRYAPLYAPRVYLDRETATDLLTLLYQYNGSLNARLDSRMEWQVKKVANVIGFSRGTTLKDQWIILFAHYDAWSVVPSLTDGATDTAGIAALIELSHFYAGVEHARSIMFIAFSGHEQGIAGARHFVDSFVIENTFPEVVSANPQKDQRVFLYLGIDISSEGTGIGVFESSYFYPENVGEGRFYLEFARPYFFYAGGFVDKINEASNRVYGKTWPIASIISLSSWWNRYISTLFSMDSDAFIVGPGKLTYRTIFVRNERRYTPIDTYSRLEDINNLKPQLEFIYCNTYDLAHVDANPNLMATWREIGSEFWSQPIFYRLNGKVTKYDEHAADYTAIPNAVVQVIVEYPGTRIGAKGLFKDRSWFETADEKGVFNIKVLRYGYNVRIYPFLLNETTSEIVYAPDFGKFGSARFPHNIMMLGVTGAFYGTTENPYPYVAFECGTIQIYNIVASESFSHDRPLMTEGDNLYREITAVEVSIFDQVSHTIAEHFSYVEDSGVVLAFVSGGEKIEIAMKYTDEINPLLILHNATDEKPVEGNGFEVKDGKVLDLIYTPYVAARDFYYLNNERLRLLAERGIFTSASPIIYSANKSLESAEQYLKNLEYDKYMSESVSCLSILRQAYNMIKTDTIDTLSTSIIVFFLLIPFAFLAERLFLGFAELRKRVIGIAIFVVAAMSPLLIFHPGFTMAVNIYVSMFGLLMFVLIGMALAFLISYGFSAFKDFRERTSGKHFEGLGKLSSIVMALGIGISYMKKRRLRTFLTLMTLIVISSSIIIFTSMVSLTTVKPFEQRKGALYKGIFMRGGDWEPFTTRFYDYVRNKYKEDLVFPRSWIYTLRLETGSGDTVIGPNGNSTIRGYYGFSSSEAITLNWTNYLYSGRIFLEYDYDVCMITLSLAQSIGANIGDKISVSGANLEVVGIFEDEVIFFKNLDGYVNSPRDLASSVDLPFFIPAGRIIYVPYLWAMEHGGDIFQIILMTEKIDETARELAMDSHASIYVANGVGADVPVYLYSQTHLYQTAGYEFVSLPLILAAFIMLNLMLGVVYERIREIGTFSTLGLSPTQVGMLFLAESLAFAVIGGMIGYVVGIVGLDLAFWNKLLPEGFYPNFASRFVMQSLGIIMGTVILSTLYPFLKVSKLVTPSLERKWKIPTRPVGDEWDIPMPFIFPSKVEVEGLLRYLKEYFEAYRIEASGFPFATQRALIKEAEEDGSISLVLDVSIPPYEARITQTVEFSTINVDNKWNLNMYIKRDTGELPRWVSANRTFIDAARKQLLMWISLNPGEKGKYMTKSIG